MRKSKKPSKPSPAAAPAKKRRPGKLPGEGAFSPSTDQREIVKLGAGIGIPERELIHAIINPGTGRPITPTTLRKAFRDELDQGLIMVKLKAGSNLLAMTATNAACAIFFAKCRLGFNERAAWAPRPGDQNYQPLPNPFDAFPPEEVDMAEGKSMIEIARRIAYTLTIGASEKPPAEPSAIRPKKAGKPAKRRQPQPA